MIAAELTKTININAQVSAPVATLSVTPAEFSTPNPNFPGIGFTGGAPSDANGAPGPNHYIQTVNATFAIWNKQGALLKPPTNINTLFTSMGGACANNNEGDPYVLYDHLADRWLISQFALPRSNPSHECIAISPTADPTAAGTWHLYDFLLPFQDDYPKLGLWPDGYYFSSQRGYPGSGVDVGVFDRANMLNGNPATFVTFHLLPPTVILLPADLAGLPPPPGTPHPFARALDSALFFGSDRVEIWEFHVDWGNLAQSTFTNTATLNTDPFISALCTPGDLADNCIPQPPSSTIPIPPPSPRLESLNVWPMGPLQYRHFGDHETLVFSHTVNATGFINNTGGTTRAGMHWYEIRRSGIWSIHQESTFAPATNDGPVNRWMGSVAMDQAGNMALGYSTSSSTDSNFPSIRYVGRLATDPLDLMTTTENRLAAGTDAQLFPGNPAAESRWGDYSAMRVDPVDGCTFWYTTQYSTGAFVTGGAAWGTRIGAFRFPTCNQADLSVTKIDSPDPVIAGNQLNYTITVTNNGPANATQVIVTDTLPLGVAFLSSSALCTGGSTKSCTIGSLASGASFTFTIQVRIPANFLSSIGASTANITNTASVSGHEFDPHLLNNTATATTNIVESADVSVSKLCTPDRVAQAGTKALCDIFVSNPGASDAQNVRLVDTLLSNASFSIVSVAVTTGSASCTSTNPVTCNLGTLAARGSDTIQVTVTTTATADINDRAAVSSTTPDPDTSNNAATGRVSFAAVAALSITNWATPNPVDAGGNLTYAISIGNAGPSTATDVVVKDTIPPQVSVLSVTTSAGSCTAGIPGNPLQPLTCTMNWLASGEAAVITLLTKVDSGVPQGTVVDNNAIVNSAVTDPDNANNSATAAVAVNARADLGIVITSDASTYERSSTIAYTVMVTNNGPSDALAVIVTDNLPTVRKAMYLSDTGGCTLTGSILTCNLGNMPVGARKSFDIYEMIRHSRGAMSNMASVASSTVDPNTANNTSTRTVTITK